MTRVLVTGATGFIGSAVLPLLKARGFEVHTIGRRRPPSSDYAFQHADLLSPNPFPAIMNATRPTHLVHLAWYAEPGLYWNSSQNFDWVAASLQLIRAFHESGGRRAVIAGSCAEYKWGGNTSLHETLSPCVPATLYGAAKDGLRRMVEVYAKIGGLSLAWGRIFHVYGPDEKRGRLVRDAIHTLLAGERFPASEGWQKRDFLHVADVAEAFVSLLAGQVEGVVNIGSGEGVAIRRVLEHLAHHIGRPELLGFGDKTISAGEPPIIEADIRRLTEDVGFSPRRDLDTGLSQTVSWWRARGRV